MKKLFLAACLPLLSVAQPGPTYWQQEVHYTMDINMDVENHQYKGLQTLKYINNSPDTLHTVFYHLYFNAFQPYSMMDERSRNIADPDRRVKDRIFNLKNEEVGYHKITWLKQDDALCYFEIEQTIMKVELPQPIPPGGTSVFTMEYQSQVPLQIRRSGRDNAEGIDFTMTQWYPKMAMYDKDGWHPDPYVGREFYANFGTFDVTIAIDNQYVVGGTGTLTNHDGIWKVKKGKKGMTTYEMNPSKMAKRKWHFTAENVHDFAWAADPDYLYKSMEGPDDIELKFYYLKEYKDTWEELPAHTYRFFELMNENYGVYEYPQFSVMQGGDGGMEYPMCTMLKGTGKLEGLVGITVHEAVHNWYYGILASNENQYPWMDEGFTSFAEAEILKVMGFEEAENPHEGAYRNFAYMVAKDIQEPLSTPADYFSVNKAYGISAYSRGELFLSQLRYIVGKQNFNRGMRTYFETWKFKHPDPWDFIRVMERTSGMQLDWYLNFWMNTNKTQDYGIKRLYAEKGMAVIELENLAEMPMPVDVTVVTKSGDEIGFTIPLVSMFAAKQNPDLQIMEPWPWTHPTYTLRTEIPMATIREVVIDKNHETTDLNRENNRLSLKEEDKP